MSLQIQRESTCLFFYNFNRNPSNQLINQNTTQMEVLKPKYRLKINPLANSTPSLKYKISPSSIRLKSQSQQYFPGPNIIGNNQIKKKNQRIKTSKQKSTLKFDKCGKKKFGHKKIISAAKNSASLTQCSLTKPSRQKQRGSLSIRDSQNSYMMLGRWTKNIGKASDKESLSDIYRKFWGILKEYNQKVWELEMENSELKKKLDQKNIRLHPGIKSSRVS